jgi:hypothetical protein
MPTTLKGLAMDTKFLRDEAARFRGMANDTNREATRVRFLAMAADYEARSGITIELAEANTSEGIIEVVEATQEEAPKITPSRKIAIGLNETSSIERRPVGRPRRE